MWYSVMRALLLVVPLLAASCVTANDLRMIADEVARIEVKANDPSVSPEEFEAALADSAERIEEVADQVEERTEKSFLTLEEGAAGGGLVGLATAIGLNLYRNSRRKRRGEPVSVPYTGPQDTVPPGGQNPG